VRIGVTGSTGFIGRYLVAELDRRRIQATLQSRSAHNPSGRDSLHTRAAFDLHSPPTDAYQLMGEPDTLLHLAWSGLPNYKSAHHVEQELPAQYEFLKALIGAGVQNLVVAGTCFEYGLQSGELSEDLEPRPINPYGLAKNALRVRLEQLQRLVPFNLIWCRLFYLFGEGQAPTSLFSQLKSAVARGTKVFDMSGGEQVRDFLSVGEAASYMVSLAVLGRNLGCVNVCSGVPISVRSIVEGWIRDNSWNIELNLGHYPYPDYEPMVFWGDRAKLNRCLQLV